MCTERCRCSCTHIPTTLTTFNSAFSQKRHHLAVTLCGCVTHLSLVSTSFELVLLLLLLLLQVMHAQLCQIDKHVQLLSCVTKSMLSLWPIWCVARWQWLHAHNSADCMHDSDKCDLNGSYSVSPSASGCGTLWNRSESTPHVICD